MECSTGLPCYNSEVVNARRVIERPEPAAKDFGNPKRSQVKLWNSQLAIFAAAERNWILNLTKIVVQATGIPWGAGTRGFGAES
jgi:hypothetical protein